MRFELQGFEPSDFLVSVEAEPLERLWQLSYLVRGDLECLAWPHREEGVFTEGLWESTCAEYFLSEQEGSAYSEWNLSPGGNWAQFCFSAYRQRSEGKSQKPQIKFDYTPERARLSTVLPLPEPGQDFNLSMILKLKTGKELFFALKHAQEPDFHLRSLWQRL